MHVRLEQIARREQALVRALDEALAEADRRLMDDVRAVALEHETRRAVILTELHTLAARIGAFPISEQPIDRLSYEHPDIETGTETPEYAADPEAPKGADWRMATQNIPDDLTDDLDDDLHHAGTAAAPPIQKAQRQA